MDKTQMNAYTSSLGKIAEKVDRLSSTVDTASLRRSISELEARIRADYESQIDFKAIVDASSDGIYISDKDAVVRYVNPAYCRHTLLTPEDLIGKSGQQILDEKIFVRIVSPEVIETKRPKVLLGYVRTVNDRDINAYCVCKPILDENGEVRYAVLTMYDPDRLHNRYDEFTSMKDGTEAPIRVRQDPVLEGVEPVVGNSRALRDVYAIAKRVAHTDATVLISGESGVGKEGVADFICTNSPRRSKPFVKVNCTAIPANLLESELFGYEKGSFTGASTKGKVGLFEQANGGTILLDEIGDLSIDLQTKLLRVIQQRELMKIGSTTPVKLDVRIIASTNADLKKKMLEGTFREDLYYRLSTIPIFVPPLRDRREDIPDLISYFLDYFGQHHHRFIQISDEHMAIFERYNWPGNIRQLRNVVEYLVVCSEDDYLTNTDQLLRILDADDELTVRAVLPTLAESMQSYEKMIISNSIRRHGSIRKAAELLGIDPATCSRKVKKYGIQLPPRKKRETTPDGE